MPENINVEISKIYDFGGDKLGAGGFGNVVVGTDKTMPRRRVAVKKVFARSSAEVDALRHEARAMKELDHPSICRLFEYYESGRCFYFVMEHLSGGELFDRIKAKGRLAECSVVNIAQQAGSALRYAHNLKIAHRDMKPENIVFVDGDRKKNEVKVIDWGLSSHFGLSRMRSSVGSNFYKAPEILQARSSYTEACDLWSFGVVVYAMLCGKFPFVGENSDRLTAMRQETFKLNDACWAGISNQAKDFIRSLLRWDPSHRMSSAEAMQHPWIRYDQQSWQQQMSDASMRQVLVNLRRFNGKSQFHTVSVANVARNLDTRSIGDVHKVFKALDFNQDGVLSLEEVRNGFERIYGTDSKETAAITDVFRELDLDDSGTVDYTEFVAAGMGAGIAQQVEAMWAAFRQFDSNGDGRLQREEICHVLHACSTQSWGCNVCCSVGDQVIQRYDKNDDGVVDFDEFTRLVRESAAGHVVGVDIVADAVAELCVFSREGQYMASNMGRHSGALRSGCISSPHPHCLGLRSSASHAVPPSCFAGCATMCTVQ